MPVEALAAEGDEQLPPPQRARIGGNPGELLRRPADHQLPARGGQHFSQRENGHRSLVSRGRPESCRGVSKAAKAPAIAAASLRAFGAVKHTPIC